MTVGEPGSELRAIEDANQEPLETPARRTPPPPGPGLGALHTTLDRLVATLSLRSLTVVIDDPDLGRQAFRAGPGPFEPGMLAGPPGCRSDPLLPLERVDAELLVELCATALRLEVTRADTPDATGVDATELALRRLPGVHAVVVERDGDFMVVQVHASVDAPADLARAAAHASMPLSETRVVVEVVRDVVQPPPAPIPAPEPVPSIPEIQPAPDVAPPPTTTDVPVIVAVRNDVEAGEMEVHIRGNDVRTIGRAPATQGLAGAVNATLDALRSIDPHLELALGWARTIETTADRRFVVAVALLHPGTRASRHGLASGASPIEAAARAALDAVTRADTAAP